MTTAQQALINDGARLMRLTVRQLHRMLAGGILNEGEPYELLDGVLIRKDRSAAGADTMTVGHQHAWVVTKLAELSDKLRRLGCHMRTQQPVTLSPHSEPEPDAAIVRGRPDDYSDRHPRARDVSCVIEVAEASLQRDRTVKLRLYARAGVPCYMIFNLTERTVEVYAKPSRSGRYAQVTTLSRGDSIEFPGAGGRRLTVPLRRLLP